MKMLVVGCGSIGQRHIRNLKGFPAVELVAHDADRRTLVEVGKKYRIPVVGSLGPALKRGVDAVLVCTPPSSHVPIAMRAAERGANLFIEKPLSHTLAGVDKLIGTARRKNRIIMVGYNFRFHPAVRLIKRMLDEGRVGRVLSARAEFGYYLPYWPHKEEYQKSYVARKALGGGIILDGSHEIDTLRWLVGEVDEVSCFASKVSDLKIETEDTAEIFLKFKNRAVAEVHLDVTRRDFSRFYELICERGTITWDYVKKLVKVYSAKSGRWQTYKVDVKLDEMYVQEMKHFVKCALGKETPLVDAREAKRTLEVVLAAKSSAKAGKAVRV